MKMAMGIMAVGDLDVLLWLHTEDDPPQDEFALAVARMVELKRRRSNLAAWRSLVITDGGAPNTLQRGQVAEVFEGIVKAAAVTTVLNNRIKRGIATAISWINPSFRAYPPEEFGAALAYLDLTPHRAPLVAEFQKVQKSLAPIKTLEMIAKGA